MKALIDTNAYTALMRGDEGIARLLDAAEVVYLSVIVAGELIAGFKGGSAERRNRTHLAEFIEEGGKTIIAPLSLDTSERFALIKDNLRRNGKPIPLNDIWIAAQCLETGAVLVSYDSHFKLIAGLLLWEP